MQRYLLIALYPLIVTSISLTACQKNPQTNASTNTSSATLVGCYTVTKTEPPQIKINLENGSYTMQMRQFNDPDKPWDSPEPLQALVQTDSKKYFDVNEKSVETALIRPDKVFAIAKVQDSLMSLDSRFDSSYLGFIAKSENIKGSNTIYKVDCDS